MHQPVASLADGRHRGRCDPRAGVFDVLGSGLVLLSLLEDAFHIGAVAAKQAVHIFERETWGLRSTL